MKHNTTRFGEIEFPEEVVMSFPEGVLGFPGDKRFVLLEHGREGSPFKWLQSADSAELAFIVLDPLEIEPQYSISLDIDTVRVIGPCDVADCAIMAICNVPHDNPILMTANLKAPLVVNVEQRRGRQMVLGTQVYPINAAVFPAINRDDAAEQKADEKTEGETETKPEAKADENAASAKQAS